MGGVDVSVFGIGERTCEAERSAGGLSSGRKMTDVPFGEDGGEDVVHRRHSARMLGFGRPSPTDPYMHGLGGTGNDSSTIREPSEPTEVRSGEARRLWKSQRDAV